jgi:asparagine synthase (glutamine-hydrolysing)
MCGIYLYTHRGNQLEYRHGSLKPRGPDAYYSFNNDDIFMAFYRLSIVGIEHGMQPITIDNVTLICNGEIYNYKELASKYDLNLRTGSDCEIVLAMYLVFGIERTINEIDGEFALIIYDKNTNLVHFARDYIGIKPLFIACSMIEDSIENIELSSELKGMVNFSYALHVMPRSIYTYDLDKRVLSTSLYSNLSCSMSLDDNELIYKTFTSAVIKRIEQSDVKVGFMLSGGLDSSLVLGVALNYYKDKFDNNWTPFDVFTFGFASDAPDVLSAKLVVDWINAKYPNAIKWHLVIKDVEDGINALPDVIYSLETYDTTTIRASTPMYLLSKYIATTDVKVILSGEGSDELFGGYLYFNYAPNDVAFRSEILTLLNNLFYFDVLRADRSTAAHGLEVRPPFLDKTFVNAVLANVNLKRGANTKQLLRDVFEGKCIIPDEILHGRKEAFSDAVGLSWKDTIVQYCSELTYEPILEKLYCSSNITPETNEMKYYQYMFGKYYYSAYHITPTLWLPNQTWVKTGVEPSARVLPIYSKVK